MNVTELTESLTNSTLITILKNVSDISTTSTEIPKTTSREILLTSTVAETESVFITKNENPEDDASTTATSLAFITLVVFVVALALITKIVISHKKKRADLISGTARWRISASRQSGILSTTGNGSSNYLPMVRGSGNRSLNQQHQPLTNGLDNPGPDRLDWERQFFDNSESTEPSHLIFR